MGKLHFFIFTIVLLFFGYLVYTKALLPRDIVDFAIGFVVATLILYQLHFKD